MNHQGDLRGAHFQDWEGRCGRGCYNMNYQGAHFRIHQGANFSIWEGMREGMREGMQEGML